MRIYLYTILFISVLLPGMTGCSTDEIDLSDYKIEVKVNETSFITIENDNGGCSITSQDENIARGEIKENMVVIYGVSAGETTIMLKDRISKLAYIEVRVTE